MIQRKGLFIAVIGTLVLTSAAYADMIPVSQQDPGRWKSSYVCGQPDLKNTNLYSPSNFPGAADLDSWSATLLPEVNSYVRQTSEMQHAKILTEGTGSFNLCLSALIGLGLCSSAHFVKRLSFGFVPEWYHNGGPFQIGHSYAVTPESLCPIQVCCFIQPVYTVEDSLPQYHRGTVTSLWWKSQFAPTVLASRGPPNLSDEVFFS